MWPKFVLAISNPEETPVRLKQMQNQVACENPETTVPKMIFQNKEVDRERTYKMRKKKKREIEQLELRLETLPYLYAT